GNYGGFGAESPPFIAPDAATPRTPPRGGGFYTFWPDSDPRVLPRGPAAFNGSYTPPLPPAHRCLPRPSRPHPAPPPVPPAPGVRRGASRTRSHDVRPLNEADQKTTNP